MTKRSSFVIPPVLVDVAAIVDILIRSPRSLMQSAPHPAELSRTKPKASRYGNIARETSPNKTFGPSHFYV